MTASHPSPVAPPSAALRSFEADWRHRSAGHPADELSALRELAMQRVLALGLPTTRDESWRYTNLRHLTSHAFVDAPAVSLQLESNAALLKARAAGPTVLLVNGHPILAGLRYEEIEGIQISKLSDVSRIDPTSIATQLRPLSDADLARWGLINAALFTDGLYVKVTGAAASPLVIAHVLTSEGANRIAHPRVIIEAAPGSRATIIEHYLAAGAAPPLCNSATHLTAGRNSSIEHYRIFSSGADAEHIDSLTIRQHEGSRCVQFTLAVGGGMVRAALDGQLNHPGASLQSYALLVGHDARHVDCVNVVTHAARDTRSTQTARAIASGSSRVIFNSKVVVNPGAAHADSRQSCRGLLLSPEAEIDARPQLEIHADEVKCAHGATTGRLDPDMLFYMLSRGLDRDTAQSLLVYAFLSDVLTPMSVPAARAAIEESLIAQLPNSQLLNEFR
jgi:Fe-S cluster assembly protein SufD